MTYLIIILINIVAYILKNYPNKNIKFAFSNVLYHNEKEHSMLKNWQEKSNYKLHLLNFSYKNCNYQRNKTSSQEVLVTNY